ncbi:VOC family protein [Bdellovibrio sp. ArHS]|uniref:VOC family protein n=1 Tax=Bdellovibrio sp. ArHS TaxID=1569284 RepID=UPI000AD7C90F|nr:VOC family protein [Bdellovibrio sp. ArHS]
MAALLTSMAENGVRIDDRIEENEHGLFAWVYDPQGNKIELWEPSHHNKTLINLPEAE